MAQQRHSYLRTYIRDVYSMLGGFPNGFDFIQFSLYTAEKGGTMSIVKVIEVISEGSSVEGAIKSAVEEASKTVENIVQINVDHIEAQVENKQVTKFRVRSEISFLVHK
jgi:dodecin